jgi:hypothetical protein
LITVILTNNSRKVLRVMLEPIGDTFDVQPSDNANVKIIDPEFEDVVQIDRHDGDFISLWVAGHVDVETGVMKLSFPEL